MTLYQLFVKGEDGAFGGRYTMHSKQVFSKEPSEEQKEAFVKACAENNFLFYLDTEHPYEVKLLELEMVEGE